MNVLHNLKFIKITIILLFVLLQVFLIFIKRHDTLDIDVYPNNAPSPNIMGNQTIGQTFAADLDNLSRIDIMMGTYARENTKTIVFQLFHLDPGRILKREKTFSASTVQNNRYHTIRFDPINNSRDKKYYFMLSSPESTTDDSLSAWMNTSNIYPPGKIRIRNRPTDGDLVFRAYFRRPVYTELGRIIRNYPGIFGNQTILICILILFEIVQIFILIKLMDFFFKTAGFQNV